MSVKPQIVRVIPTSPYLAARPEEVKQMMTEALTLIAART
jgi:hypothetical protein